MKTKLKVPKIKTPTVADAIKKHHEGDYRLPHLGAKRKKRKEPKGYM